jgi:hypothetical protein
MTNSMGFGIWLFLMTTLIIIYYERDGSTLAWDSAPFSYSIVTKKFKYDDLVTLSHCCVAGSYCFPRNNLFFQ